MTAKLSNETHENKVLIEQVTILFQSMVSLLMINLVVSICLAFAFWQVVETNSMMLWLGMMLLMLVLRAAIYINYKRTFSIKKILKFKFFLVLGSGVAGVIWGLGGILLFSETQLEYQVFLLFALMAMISGSAFVLSIYLPSFFAFVPLVLLPITIKLLSMGSTVHYSLAALSIAYLIALIVFSMKINANLKHSLNLRFENFDLIEQLKIQKAEAERANSAKSKFLAAASHDLRQPLYSLTLFTSVLNELSDNVKTREVVQKINQSVDALKNLFDALLDISKLDAGVVEAEKTNVPLANIFSNLANEFDMQAASKGLTINWPRCDYFVVSEPTLLEQILVNYLSNAIRYTEHGSITVDCNVADGQLSISVADTGIGICEQQMSAVYEEFYQVGNQERERDKGLGLGLAIVKRTATLLGHPIGLDSSLGKGSVFSITMSLSAKEITHLARSTHASKFGSKVVQSLVVVIDNEKDVREGIQQLLTLWGYDVIAVGSQEDALEMLTDENLAPDVIISDYRLSDNLTGIDAITALRDAFSSSIPAILVTGDTSKTSVAKMNSHDFDVLYKPVPPAKLRAFLNSV